MKARARAYGPALRCFAFAEDFSSRTRRKCARRWGPAGAGLNFRTPQYLLRYKRILLARGFRPGRIAEKDWERGRERES